MAALKSPVLLVALLLSLPGSTHTFLPLFSLSEKSITHSDITQRAILRKTAQVCQGLAAAKGLDFNLEIDDSLTVYEVQQACFPAGASEMPLSTVKFQSSIANMYLSNAAVDVVFALSAERHFDDETFQVGRDIITTGVSAVKASVKLETFITGRLILGQVCHTLQDFYSHSNWMELGNRVPYSSLIRPDQPLENLAGLSTPTCKNCTQRNCTDNLLPEVLQQGLLTSGYFSVLSSTKPAGKCSHGGSFDRTSRIEPVGGINKDDIEAEHGHLHLKAANMAVDATMELLEDIRGAAGDRNFLRLMGLSQSSVLCFVIDTTGSMSDDIEEAKRVSFSIIDSKRGTPQEPYLYILVPFNDPGFGGVIMTSEPDVFKERINELEAKGGGDIPELCMSGLQLALTAAPPSTEIFVFTDAPAKDAHLKSVVVALIESTKSVVTFMLTDNLSRRRRGLQNANARRLSQSDAQLYYDLAQASGGQAIEVTKSELSKATSIIEDASANAMVTVLQAVRNPGKDDNFTFTVDSSMRNLTAYITGASLTFNLTSPSGVSQTSGQPSGPLGSYSTVGNLRRLSLGTGGQAGSWEISIRSNDPYSLKVIGESSVNFIYNFVEAHEGVHRDFSLKEGRPLTGSNVSLLVTVTGSDTAKVTEATLVEGSGSREVNASVQSLGSGDFLVTFYSVPEGRFALRLKGEDNTTSRSTASTSFQRQASTQVTTSSISVTVQANSTIVEPGSTISIPFTVSTTSNGSISDTGIGTFTVQATNDRGYTSSSPSTVSNETSSGIVTLAVPASAASGSDVTLTIGVENAAATDSNYAVLRLSVVAKVTDLTRPVCQVVSLSACPSPPSLCTSSQWEFSANLTDGINGTGIDRLTVRQGNGTLDTNSVVGAGGENVTLATYSASCCTQAVELVAVDRAGNVGMCAAQAKSTGATSAAPVINTSTAVSVTSTGGRRMTVSQGLWISTLACLLWK